MVIRLSDSEAKALIAALRVAAEEYRASAALCLRLAPSEVPRLLGQAVEAEDLALRLDCAQGSDTG